MYSFLFLLVFACLYRGFTLVLGATVWAPITLFVTLLVKRAIQIQFHLRIVQPNNQSYYRDLRYEK